MSEEATSKKKMTPKEFYESEGGRLIMDPPGYIKPSVQKLLLSNPNDPKDGNEVLENEKLVHAALSRQLIFCQIKHSLFSTSFPCKEPLVRFTFICLPLSYLNS
jgi:hypothetical protein